MKKLLCSIVAVLMFAGPALAADISITFGWNQTIGAGFGGWGLYYSTKAGGPYTLLADVPYVAEQTQYSKEVSFTVADGSKTTLYFVVDAYNKNGLRSKYSNEVPYTIDLETPGTPINLTIVIKLK